jgi:LmbE family N-acetylglucosaminyl deacetylase
MKKILLLSPHPDDIELSMGGYLLRMANDKDCEVHVMLFSDCDIENEFNDSMKIVNPNTIHKPPKLFKVRKFWKRRGDILDSLIFVQRSLKPDIVFCPAPGDTHQDHKVIFEEAFRAFKHTTLIGYIMPHNMTEIRPNYFVELSGEDVVKKLGLIENYESQLERYYIDSIAEVVVFYGRMTNKKYCEAFEIIRMFG